MNGCTNEIKIEIKIMKILTYLALLSWLTASAAEAPVYETAGIGIALGVEGQNIVVKRILPDSPAAAQKDLHEGDRIMAVAQAKELPVRVQGRTLAQTVALIRGPKGTTVRLTIVPYGEDDSRARVISFTRDELKALAHWGDGVLLTNGVKAPNIEMNVLANGKSERLSDYASKIVVLKFWATWCGPCQAVMADFQSYAGKHPDWNGRVVLIAASVDDDKDVAIKRLQAKGWDQTHNVWVGTDAIKSCHINGVPTAYVINRKGKIVAADPVDLPGIVNHELLKTQDADTK